MHMHVHNWYPLVTYIIYVHTYEVPTYVLLCCIIRKVLASSTKWYCELQESAYLIRLGYNSGSHQLCTVQNRLVCIHGIHHGILTPSKQY